MNNMPLSTQLIAIAAMFVNFFFPVLSMFVFMSKGIKIAQQTEHHPMLYGIASAVMGLVLGFAFAVGINYVIEKGPGVCVREIVCNVTKLPNSSFSCDVYKCK